MGKESKEVSNNLVNRGKKPEPDLQEEGFTELFVVQHKFTNEDLMELQAQKKDQEKQDEDITEEPKRCITRK